MAAIESAEMSKEDRDLLLNTEAMVAAELVERKSEFQVLVGRAFYRFSEYRHELPNQYSALLFAADGGRTLQLLSHPRDLYRAHYFDEESEERECYSNQMEHLPTMAVVGRLKEDLFSEDSPFRPVQARQSVAVA